MWRRLLEAFGENTVIRRPHRVLGTPLAGPFTDDLVFTVVAAVSADSKFNTKDTLAKCD